MKFLPALSILLALVAAALLVGLLFLRGVGRALFSRMLANQPQVQQSAFVIHLRELVFGNPCAYMTSLCAADGREFVRRLWVEVGWKVARVRRPVQPADPAMDAVHFRFNDGRTIAVVSLPPPQHPGETLLIGVVLPMHPTLKEDLQAARARVRYFILNRFDGPDRSRTTDLCGRTIKREKRTYNVCAPQDAQGFAGAVEAKLRELGQ